MLKPGSLCIAGLFLVIAQPGNAGWIRTYGGENTEQGENVVTLPDNSYLAIGSVVFRDTCILLNLNADGDTLWTKSYNGRAHSLDTTTDGNYVITGTRNGNLFVTKVGHSGQVIWDRIYRDYGDGGELMGNVGICIAGTMDGGAVITGQTLFRDPDTIWKFYLRLLLLKINSEGEENWSLVPDADVKDWAYYDWGSCVKQTDDGGYFLLGIKHAFNGAAGGQAWCIKTDSLGEIIWDSTYEFGYACFGNSITSSSDGGYIFTGEIMDDSSKFSLFLARIDSLGSLKWEKSIPNSQGEWIEQLNDGNYIVAGNIMGDQDYDLWMLKISASGDTLWTRSYSVGKATDGSCIKQTLDGGFIIIGSAVSYNDTLRNYSDILLIKTDSLGLLGVTSPPATPVTHQPSSELEISSPINSEIVLSYSVGSGEVTSLRLFDASGRMVKNLSVRGTGEAKVSRLSAGVYFARLEAGNTGVTKKIVVVR